MDLHRADRHNLTDFYITRGSGTAKDLKLLGFRKGIAVFGWTDMSVKVVNLEMDQSTGEKYISINGKKIKVVTKSKLTDAMRKNAKVLTKVNPNQNVTLPTGSSNIVFVNPDKDGKDKDEETDEPVAKRASLNKHVYSSGKVKNLFNQTVLQAIRSKYIDREPTPQASIIFDPENTNPVYINTGVQTEMVEDRGKTMVDSGCQTDPVVMLDSFPGLDSFGPLLMDAYMNENFHMCLYPQRNPLLNGNVNFRNNPKFKFLRDLKTALVMDNKGNLPIHNAVLDNNLDNVKRFAVVLQAAGKDVNEVNQDNYSPLQLAVFSEASTKIVTYLLCNGANFYQTDQEGNSVLHLAVQYVNEAALEVLCEHADKNNLDVDLFNYEGFTPLMLSCINKNLKCAEILLRHKAGPNTQDKKSGRTSLFHAAENHHLEMVSLLLDWDADTKIRNFFGTSTHDAMFEMEDIPRDIRQLIWAKKRKRDRADNSKKSADVDAAPRPKQFKFVKTYQRVGKQLVKQNDP